MTRFSRFLVHTNTPPSLEKNKVTIAFGPKAKTLSSSPRPAST